MKKYIALILLITSASSFGYLDNETALDRFQRVLSNQAVNHQEDVKFAVETLLKKVKTETDAIFTELDKDLKQYNSAMNEANNLFNANKITREQLTVLVDSYTDFSKRAIEVARIKTQGIITAATAEVEEKVEKITKEHEAKAKSLLKDSTGITE